jgi:crossover junction endodeoxyribonuclease RuvC
MGYGVVEAQGSNVRLMEGGIVQGGAHSVPLAKRLAALYDGIIGVVGDYHPDVLALEEIYSHYAYPNTAVLMGHARGIVCLAAFQNAIPVVSYAATQVKHFMVGSGKASKAQIQRAVQTRLSLKEVPEPNDVSDALALALCHWQVTIANMTLDGPEAI